MTDDDVTLDDERTAVALARAIHAGDDAAVTVLLAAWIDGACAHKEMSHRERDPQGFTVDPSVKSSASLHRRLIRQVRFLSSFERALDIRRTAMVRRSVLAVLALVTLAACPAAQRSRGLSVPRPANSSARLRPPSTPSVFPISVPSIIGYEPPDLDLRASVEPNAELRVGSTVIAKISVKNGGAARRDVDVELELDPQSTWHVATKPPDWRTLATCGDVILPVTEPVQAGCRITSLSMERESLAAGRTREFAFTLQLTGYRCPGAGDYIGNFTVSIPGPLLRGPNEFEIDAWFVNGGGNPPSPTGDPSPSSPCAQSSRE